MREIWQYNLGLTIISGNQKNRQRERSPLCSMSDIFNFLLHPIRCRITYFSTKSKESLRWEDKTYTIKLNNTFNNNSRNFIVKSFHFRKRRSWKIRKMFEKKQNILSCWNYPWIDSTRNQNHSNYYC